MSKIKIGHHLEAARKMASLSMDDAAKKLGIDRLSLRRYEQDQRSPNAEILLNMARLYKCGIGHLVGASESNASPIPIAGEVIDAQTFKFNEEGPYKEFLPIADSKDVFALKVVSNALSGIAYTGEYLIIQRHSTPERLAFNLAAELTKEQPVGKIIGVYRRPKHGND